MPRTPTRLYVTTDLAARVPVTLPQHQAHYLHNVLRLGPGDQVGLFNGRHGEWLALIEGIERKHATLLPCENLRPQAAEPGPWLLFAPLKKDNTDFLIGKATELGVEALWPVFTRNTAATRINAERLEANVVEAAEQCGRLTVPRILEPATLAELPGLWPAGRPLWIADERGGGLTFADAATADGHPPPGIVIGPEGGFAPGELDELAKLSFVRRVSLGPRILRAETAAVAALACWQALAGDWS